MRRLRVTALVVAATALAAAGVFVLWATLGAPGVASVARNLVVTVAMAPQSEPAALPTQTPTTPLVPFCETPLTASAPPSATMVAKRTRPPVKTGAIVVRFRDNNAASR